MPPAVAVAGITAAATIGGAVMSNKATKKAASTAAGAASDASAANTALAREIYGQNAARLDPYAAGGMQAGNVLRGALGLGGGMAAPAAGGAGGYPSGTGALAGYGGASPQNAWEEGALNAMLAVTGPKRTAKAMRLSDTASQLAYLKSVAHPDERAAYQAYIANNPMPTATAPAPGTGTPATGTPAAPGQTAAQGALEAFNAFKNSGNYQFLFDEGNKALQMTALGGGGFDSGASR